MRPCATCCYWKAGECRRFPTFVERGPEDWCGEHARLGTHWQKFLANPIEAAIVLACVAVFAVTAFVLLHRGFL